MRWWGGEAGSTDRKGGVRREKERGNYRRIEASHGQRGKKAGRGGGCD